MGVLDVAGQRATVTGGVQEAERTFEAPAGGLPTSLPDDLGRWTPARRLSLRAEYFDTPALHLTGAGWSLRRRTGGLDPGWHLKAPKVGDVRLESQLPPDALFVPSEFRALVAGVVGGRPLIPVAVLRTERDESDLLDAAGRVRAHLCVDAVTAEVEGGASAWGEIEVELAPGEPLSTLDAVGALLLAAGCTPAGHQSKVARALERRVARPSPTEQGGAALTVVAYAAKQVGALQSLEAGVRADTPDAVHKARVAARRLRSVLTRFAPLFERARTRPLLDELRWFGEVAGAPRDAEVLAEHVAEELSWVSGGAAAAAIASLLADLGERRRAAHRDLVAALDGPRFAALSADLARWLADEPVVARGRRPAADELPVLVTRAVARVERRLALAQAEPQELAAWHEVRKAAKAVRYSWEAVALVVGADAAERVARWEAVTERLGEVQDTVVNLEVLADAARSAGSRGEPVAPYRELERRQHDKRRAALDAGVRAIDEALRAER